MWKTTALAILLAATAWAAPLPPAAPLGTSATDLAVSATIPLSPTDISTTVAPTSPYHTQVVVALPQASTNPREDALAKATTLGLQQVLATLGTDAQTSANLTSGTDVSKYLSTYKIVKETLTPSYTLVADMTYSQPLVDAALGRSPQAATVNPLAVAETAPVVLLPLMAFEGRQWLWEDENPWRQALVMAAAQVSGTPMLAPQADADTLRTLPAATVAESYTLTPELADLQTQYKARGILIADAAMEEGGTEQAVVVSARWLGMEAPVINLRQPVENGLSFEDTLAELAQVTLAEAQAQLANVPEGSGAAGVTWDTGAALYLRLMATDVTQLERLSGWVNGYADTSGQWQMVSKGEAIMAVQTPNIQGLESFLRTQGLRLNPDGPFTRVDF